ncbi:MAG: cyclic nucleotide-binding domain-containing protein [Burkholderiales bacterium]|nr:cyclic nucleotide-binding domain-containing protein [Burkholderiales bacterium]
MPPDPLFPGFRSLGDASPFAAQIRAVVPHNGLFDDFTEEDLRRLGPFMRVYVAPPQGVIIREGDAGDFMLFIIDGLVDVTKEDRFGNVKRIAVVKGGQALGEMSMIDGEARFASCTAIEETTFAYLSRPSLQALITNEPRIAAKILMKLVFMLSQRLRQTSSKLVNAIEK